MKIHSELLLSSCFLSIQKRKNKNTQHYLPKKSFLRMACCYKNNKIKVFYVAGAIVGIRDVSVCETAKQTVLLAKALILCVILCSRIFG